MFLDLINTVYILTILLILQKYYKFGNLIFILLIGHLFSIYLFNDFLFSSSMMPDQYRYFEVVHHLRNFQFIKISETSITVLSASIFFALVPLPFIESLYSIGMINYLLYLFIFIFAIKKRIFNNKFSIYFYLLFPSLLLYSSIALRDMLVFSVMFIGIYYLLQHRYMASFFILSILIKFQNFIVILSVFGILLFLKKSNMIYKLISSFILILLLYKYIDCFLIEMLNKYKHAFYNENIENITEVFVPISSWSNLFTMIVPDVVHFMFRPLPWRETGLLQIVQFIENCLIVSIVLFIFYKNKVKKLYKINEVIFLNSFFLLGILIYALVSFNSGTAVRYKFPFTAIYIIYSFYYINLYSNYNKGTINNNV